MRGKNHYSFVPVDDKSQVFYNFLNKKSIRILAQEAFDGEKQRTGRL